MASRIFAQAGPSRVQSPALRKLFSTSFASRNASAGSETYRDTDEASGMTHYDTLGIPHSASRMEIKAAYFRLSKRYHPDVRRGARSNAEGGRSESKAVGMEQQREKDAEKKDTERFHEVSAAYRVLSDDRQRRAYDRSIASSHVHRSRVPHAHAHAHTPGSSHSHAYTYELHSRRKRGATHAWENTGPRSYAGRSHTHPHSHSHLHASAAGTGSGVGAGRHYDPTASPSSQYQSTANNASSSSPRPDTSKQSERLTGRALRTEEEREAHDRIIRDSNVARFFRVIGIVLIVTWVGGLGKTLGS